MTGTTQSFIDLLSTNLAHIFHRYLFVRNKQICSHKLNLNNNLSSSIIHPVKKVRINMKKYGHLFNSISNQNINNKLRQNNSISKKTTKKIHKKTKQRNKKKMKIKRKKTNSKRENKLQTSKTMDIPSSASSLSSQTKTQLSRDLTSETEDHQSSKFSRVSSSTPLITSKISISKQDVSSNNPPLDISNQCREKTKFLYDVKPKVNTNYINTRNLSNELPLTNALQHKKMKQYSKNLKPEQLFRCPKDSRSKRRKCCGVYYELFDDAWRLLEAWFIRE